MTAPCADHAIRQSFEIICQTTDTVARENSQHFATPPLVS